MYLKKIELDNTGPIERIKHELPFNEDGTPKPVVFVGQNGAGKSIVLGHIVNAMISAKAELFDDSEIEKGRVYKLRSPQYVKHDQHYSRAKLIFSDDFIQSEIQLNVLKKEFKSKYKYQPPYENWDNMPEDASSDYVNGFHARSKEFEDILNKTTLLFFPSNRFEEPAWLNVDNLVNMTTYLSTKQMKGVSGRKIIDYSPLRENQNWLLDLLYDSFAIERKVQNIQLDEKSPILPLLIDTQGVATITRTEVERFLLKLFQSEPPLTWNVGRRGLRAISLMGNGKVLSNNLFSLSTGQTILLNIFLSIMRDFDLSKGNFSSLAEVKGIVVIDEVDLHLHTKFQHTILPELIALFPKVQFILTSHSPLFLMGLNKKFGDGNFDVIDLPSGSIIDVERFCEFEAAYKYFSDSAEFENNIKEEIAKSQKTILFVEGNTDKDYLTKAADLLGQKELLDEIMIWDANGFGGLDKIWRNFNTKLSDAISQKVVLLYDCDIPKSDGQKGKAYRRIVPIQANTIKKGIENLFPDAAVQRAIQNDPAFVNIEKKSQ